ncbi:uncharacterized protein [Triticum aestivum]|uniref:uncharacterized protein n=1 Tax=Triticum aestivum TaxID=4565 RepID=UPI001D019325|nr:uncharacterized protein LOC123147181 [Triticum aestivum]
MAKDLLWELALMAWPLLKVEAAELAKSVLRELAREEAKMRLKAAVKVGAEGLKGLFEAPPSTPTPAPAAEVADPRQGELLVDGAAVCIDHAPLLLRRPQLRHSPPLRRRRPPRQGGAKPPRSARPRHGAGATSRWSASSMTAATAGATAQALPSLLDFVVCASALGVIALALYLIWRGPGGGGD